MINDTQTYDTHDTGPVAVTGRVPSRPALCAAARPRPAAPPAVTCAGGAAMAAHLSSGRVNLTALREAGRRELREFLDKCAGSKVGTAGPRGRRGPGAGGAQRAACPV